MTATRERMIKTVDEAVWAKALGIMLPVMTVHRARLKTR